MEKLTEYEFEYQWGGEDTWFTKANRWAKKQKFPINHLALGLIVWLWEKWVDGRVQMEMVSVDKQVEEIKEQWSQQEDDTWVKESSPSEIEGLDIIRITNKAVLPNVWECDWNDVLINHKLWNKDESNTSTTK